MSQTAIEEIIESVEGFGQIDVIEMNMDSLESVKNAAKYFLSKSQQLNVVINNAGKSILP